MGEGAEEAPEEVKQDPIQTQPVQVSSPVTIGSSESPAKVQPKGNLVVNPSVLREPTVTTVSMGEYFHFSLLFL